MYKARLLLTGMIVDHGTTGSCRAVLLPHSCSLLTDIISDDHPANPSGPHFHTSRPEPNETD